MVFRQVWLLNGHMVAIGISSTSPHRRRRRDLPLPPRHIASLPDLIYISPVHDNDKFRGSVHPMRIILASGIRQDEFIDKVDH